MSDEATRFSYWVMVCAEAHRQLKRPMDGNLLTALVAIQCDIDRVKAAMNAANAEVSDGAGGKL
jgi:hypothetical protein